MGNSYLLFAALRLGHKVRLGLDLSVLFRALWYTNNVRYSFCGSQCKKEIFQPIWVRVKRGATGAGNSDARKKDVINRKGVSTHE